MTYPDYVLNQAHKYTVTVIAEAKTHIQSNIQQLLYESIFQAYLQGYADGSMDT